jgi:hypothetical protein
VYLEGGVACALARLTAPQAIQNVNAIEEIENKLAHLTAPQSRQNINTTANY